MDDDNPDVKRRVASVTRQGEGAYCLHQCTTFYCAQLKRLT